MSHTEMPAPAPQYATIGRRFAAYLVDVLIGVAMYAVAFGAEVALGAGSGASLVVAGLLYLGIVAYGIYVLYLTAKRGYTPGKKMMGIRVVGAADLQPIGWGRALVRGLLNGLLLGLCGIGALVNMVIANGHPRRQGWHDLVADSVVVPESALIVPTPPRPAPAEGMLSVRLPTVSDPAATTSPAVAAPQPQPQPSPGAPSAPPSAGGGPDAPPAVPTQPPSPVSGPGALIGPPPGAVPPPSSPPSSPPSVAVPPPSSPVSSPPPVAVSPSSPASSPPQPVETEPVDESTRMAARRAPASTWVLAPTIGLAHPMIADVLVGRDPDQSLVDGATTWSVDDPERTVSKSHALFTVDDDALMVEDWNSTNGVVIRRDEGDMELPPRQPTQLAVGDAVLLGDFEIRVRRG